ncbi:MAG: DUF86 domain-containing protein [Patescibacteria group bacterium]|nr:DUF86 domain-containing protein [Patescibacteria group bacterium]
MSKLPIEYLKHIRDELEYISSASKGLSKNEFLQDETLKRSFTRSIEIIGEAVKNLPINFRNSQSHIDWQSISGMRDKLIHGYFGIDYDIVWDVVKNEAPVLKVEIEKLIQSINK